jgi:autotransporter-associated beta strand protein
MFGRSRNVQRAATAAGRSSLRRTLHLEQLEDRRLLTLLGQQIFPLDYPWNQDISNAPVAANSAAIIANIGDSVTIHPDWGEDNPANGKSPLYGIPYNVVHGKTTAKVNVSIDNYPGESDIVPVPIPAGAVIEGDYQNGPNPNGGGYKTGQRGDSHLIVWDEDSDTAYELYGVTRPSDPTLFPNTSNHELPHTDGKWHAAQETVWHMSTDEFRTLGYTSADAAGLSILAGLARPDEGIPVTQGGQGAINHALRMTLPSGDVNPQYVYPGSHMVSTSQGSDNLPLGARLRLMNNTTVNNLINGTPNSPGMPPESKIIAQAMQKYGLVLADIGSAMYVTGASASQDANNNIAQTWDTSDIFASNGLEVLTAADFEVVNLTPIVTSLSATSGAANSAIFVNGQNFSGAAGQISVFFGSVASNSVTVLSDTQLSVLVPSGIGTVDVTVQSGVNETDTGNPSANVNAPIFGYGTSATSAADKFTFTGGAEWTNGAQSLRWTDALNWSPSGVPGASTNAFFTNFGLTNGATVNLNGSQSARSLAIQGTVNFTLGGSGSLTLASGYLVRSPGASGTQTISQPVMIGANGMFYIAGAGQLNISSPISGAFPLEKLNAGTLMLSGANTYSKGTIVAGGTLVVANSNAILSGSDLTVGANAASVFAPVVGMAAPVITTRSVSEGSTTRVQVPTTQSSVVAAPVPAATLIAPRIDRSLVSGAIHRAAADIALLRAVSGSDDQDPTNHKTTDRTLDALFAQYGR